MALDVKRFVARFVDEARDHLRNLDDGLRDLAQGTGTGDSINALFRSAHTIKGSSRMLKLTTITETAHRVEDVLGALRDGSLTWTPDLGRLLQRGMDGIASLVDRVADGGDLGEPDQDLCRDLAAVLAPQGDQPAPLPSPSPSPSVSPPPAAPSSDIRLKSAETVRVQLSKLDDLIKLMGEVVSSHARLRQRLVDVRQLERHDDAGHKDMQAHIRAFGRDLRDDVFSQELLMEELHAKALIMRMLPLSMVLEPAARMVRDLGRSLGKEVECLTSGLEIELDRQLIDRLGDPIVHLLRNAVDHGIETADRRQQAGKPRQGQMRLTARQDGGWVLIEVADDGNGLPIAAIRDKAVQKKLLTAEQAAALPEADVVDLIFQPGFSTSSIITDVSGRGVGMDVVKRCVVDDLQGVIAVETVPGRGTTFSLRLPLSLAVMRVLLVSSGGQTFGVTAQYVAQLLEVRDGDILTVAQRRAIILHNEFVPVIALDALLGLPQMGAASDRHLLLVVKVRNEKLALRVDDLLDERDMVIKPLPDHLRHLPLVSGMVMTGRNALVSILHTPMVLDAARRLRGDQPQVADNRSGLRVLVVDDSLNTREIERDVLEAHGYHVTLAEDGLDGLGKARATPFDAVLTDVEMPNMDGFSFTAALRQEAHYQSVPIIIVTSREKEEDKRRGIQVGADAYIVKGDFEQSSLVDTLRSLLG